MLNLSAVLFGANDLRLEKRNVPNPNGSEVLVKMDSVGICGSDVHFWKYGGNAYARVETPMILGHEGAGRVERLDPFMTFVAFFVRCCDFHAEGF